MSFEHGLDVHLSGYRYCLSGVDCRFFLRRWIRLCFGGLIGLGDPFGLIGLPLLCRERAMHLGFLLFRGNAVGVWDWFLNLYSPCCCIVKPHCFGRVRCILDFIHLTSDSSEM